MQVSFEENKVKIDDAIEVEKKDGEYFFQVGDHEVKVSKNKPTMNLGYTVPVVKKDPHVYKNGNNNLTLKASVERAFNQVYDGIWFNLTQGEQVGDLDLLVNAITIMIERGDGRNAVYALAGSIKRDIATGRFVGVPAALIMYGIVKGYIKEPEKVDAGHFEFSY